LIVERQDFLPSAAAAARTLRDPSVDPNWRAATSGTRGTYFRCMPPKSRHAGFETLKIRKSFVSRVRSALADAVAAASRCRGGG